MHLELLALVSAAWFSLGGSGYTAPAEKGLGSLAWCDSLGERDLPTNLRVLDKSHVYFIPLDAQGAYLDMLGQHEFVEISQKILERAPLSPDEKFHHYYLVRYPLFGFRSPITESNLRFGIEHFDVMVSKDGTRVYTESGHLGPAAVPLKFTAVIGLDKPVRTVKSLCPGAL